MVTELVLDPEDISCGVTGTCCCCRMLSSLFALSRDLERPLFNRYLCVVIMTFLILLLHLRVGLSFLTWLMLLVFIYPITFRVRRSKVSRVVWLFHCKCQVELDEMMPEFGIVLGDDFLPEDLGEALRKGCIQYPSKTQLLGCWEVEKVFLGQ